MQPCERMGLSRRAFLSGTACGLAALGSACRDSKPPAGTPVPGGPRRDEWSELRDQFDLSDGCVHMSALLVSSHPHPVREAIERYRRELDRNPTVYLQRHNRRLQHRARAAAAEYLAGDPDEVALTDSTTMGLGLLYGGLRLEPDQEVLTTSNDYYATHEALRVAAGRTGAVLRDMPLYAHGEAVSVDALVHRVTRAITPATRVLALTWVHSSTGVKMPLADLAASIAEINDRRQDEDRVLVCVDGVHGFGVEDATMDDLGVDFFAAGCHKWLFGPRGTGILWGRKDAWGRVRPTIPSFIDDQTWTAWLAGHEPPGPATAARVTPGGFKPFEHQWALTEAFELHQRLGKARVARRTHDLARQLKDGLARMRHVRLVTPIDERLSAGIVCFDVEGLHPHAVVRRLLDRGIVGTTTPYATVHARLTPSIRNTEEEVEAALRAVRSLA